MCIYRLLLASVMVAVAVCLSASEPDAAQAAKDRAVVETLLRLKGMDVNSSPQWKAAAVRHLETVKGTPRYVDLVGRLRLRGVEDELFRVAIEDPASTAGVKAAMILVKVGEGSRFEQAAKGDDEPMALKAITALGAVGGVATVEALKPLIMDANRGAPVRVAAAQAIGKNRGGQSFLLELAQSGKLPSELKFTAANILLASADEAIRDEAGRHLTLPAAANSQPLPPIDQLVGMKGDPSRGRHVFQTTGTCAKCHKVRGEGKEVGPDLSEIGAKLSQEAFFVSILDPNAGISHNFDSYVLVTTEGKVLTGLLISRTEQSLTIRTAEAIDHDVPVAEIDELQKSRTSLMPADLQKLLTIQDLVDVVAYLGTLKQQP